MVRHVHIRFGDLVQQGGFAGVGVTHEGYRGDARSFSLGAVTLTVRADFFELFFEVRDLAADGAFIYFELRFTGSAQADAPGGTGAPAASACLSFEVRPLPGEARQVVFVLRQLYL